MGNVFKNQDYLTLYLDTNVILTGATTLQILYRKPDGETGEWDGTESGTNIKYLIGPGDIDQAGQWTFQSKFVLNGEKAYGDKVYQKFQTNLD